MGPIAAYRGRWDAEATSRWHELGRPRLAFSPGDGQTTLDFLDDLDGLRHLSVIGQVQTRDDAVERCEALEWLMLDDGLKRRLDWSALHELTDLDLALDRCGPSLGRLPRLTRLRTYWTQPGLGDLQPGLALEDVTLIARSLADLSGIAELPNLTTLHIHLARKVADLAPLAACRSLLRLHLTGLTALEDLSALAESRSIEELTLQTCRNLLSVRPLTQMTQLRQVSLNVGTVVADGDIACLLHLPNLRGLGVDQAVKSHNVTAAQIEAALQPRHAPTAEQPQA
jgi:D-alanyl-D-alanine dipeptidase